MKINSPKIKTSFYVQIEKEYSKSSFGLKNLGLKRTFKSKDLRNNNAMKLDENSYSQKDLRKDMELQSWIKYLRQTLVFM